MDLFHMAEQLRVLITACLLTELGLSSDHAGQLIRDRSQAYEAARSMQL